MKFDFFAPTRLITGLNCVNDNAWRFSALGKKGIIVTSGSAGKKSGALDDVKAVLDSADISYIIHDRVKQNPLLEDAFEAGKKAAEFGADFVVGIGGGSPLDACKAAAIFATNHTLSLLDIFKLDWDNTPLPIIAVGTTAGTGSEVNGFSVLTKPDGRKQSISHPDCYPKIAFGDAKYTFTLPYSFTVSTALDSMAHALEGYYSTASNPISDMFALEAVRALIPALNALKETNGKAISHELREQLYYSSVIAGYTLGMCGTLYCHVLGYFLSEEHDIPHGYACAVFLPDMLARHLELVPDKSERLEKSVGITISQLSQLISSMTIPVDIALTEEEIKALVDAKIATGNFVKTPPNGITAEEGYQLMRNVFIKK